MTTNADLWNLIMWLLIIQMAFNVFIAIMMVRISFKTNGLR